jgi:hypothetical protein
MLYDSTFLTMASHVRPQSLIKSVLFFFTRIPSVFFVFGYPISRRKVIVSLNLTYIYVVLLSTITKIVIFRHWLVAYSVGEKALREVVTL